MYSYLLVLLTCTLLPFYLTSLSLSSPPGVPPGVGYIVPKSNHTPLGNSRFSAEISRRCGKLCKLRRGGSGRAEGEYQKNAGRNPEPQVMRDRMKFQSWGDWLVVLLKWHCLPCFSLLFFLKCVRWRWDGGEELRLRISGSLGREVGWVGSTWVNGAVFKSCFRARSVGYLLCPSSGWSLPGGWPALQ